MTNPYDSSGYPNGCEILIPITLKIPIYLQPEEAKKTTVFCPSVSQLFPDSSTTSDRRVFLYEVVGLRQNVRYSGRIWLTVPYNRMNQEMRRITRQGGQIISVQPI